MKAKKLSKVLALLLACAMIFTTLPLMAFANTETYTVSYGSPAILMNESTKVNLNDLLFEMDAAGTTVPGNLITFTAKADDGFAYNPVDKSVIAYGKGTYKLTANYNGIEKTIYVMVKKADETEFVLLDYDFTVDKFVPEEWNLIYYNKHGGTVGTAKATDGTNPAYFTDNSGKANGYILVAPNNGQETNASGSKLWVNHGVLVNNNPIFKDFADYTVITSMRTNGNLTNEWAGAGVVGRVNLAENGTFDPNIASVIGYLQGNGNMMIESHIGGAWANGTKTYSGSLVNSESTVNNEKYYWHSGVFHTMTTKFDGDNIVYNVSSIDNTETIEIFDSSKASDSVKSTWAKDGYKAVQPGFPGVIAWDGGCRLQKFTVKLNDNTLAPATELSYYNVSYAAPAILMNENTAVDLDFITVEMDSQGTIATGDKIEWNAAKQENLYLNKEGNKVSVYAAGQYKLTATANGITKNVWIIANKADETDFYLANIPEFNASTFDASDWKIFAQKEDTGSAKEESISTTSDSIKTSANNRFIVYTKEIFKDFADYTVIASIDAETDDRATTNVHRGGGVVGRVNIADDGKWDFSGVTGYILQNKSLAVRKNQAAYSYAYIGSSIDVYQRDENGDIVLGGDKGTTQLTVPEKKAWYGTTYHTLKNVFSGSKVEFYFDDALLHDSTTLASYPSAAQTAPGYPGVLGHDCTVKIKSFVVKLNSNKMPDAIAAETPSDKIDYYNVTDASPAIPMNAFTVLDTKYIAVEFDGQFIPGDQITFALANPTSNVEVAGGKITAYVKGTYKVNATYEGTTKALYVVVKDATDSQFVLYTEEFGDYTGITTFPANWKSQWRQDGKYGKEGVAIYQWTDFTSPRAYSRLSINQGTTSPGIVPFTNPASWNAAGYFTLNDAVVSAFADYTITATMAAYSNFNSYNSGTGIYGRANVTADGKLDNKSTLTGVYSGSNNTDKEAIKLESAPGDTETTANITRSTLGTGWDYTNRNSSTESVTMVLKFAGTDIVTYMKGDDQIITGTTTNTQKGAVGIHTGMCGDNNIASFVNLREFTVTLNNAADDMPEAETISMYGVSYNDPVIVMHNNTYTNFKKMTVQLENGGQAYMATDVTWTANTTEGIEVVNGEDGKIVAHANGIYTLTATVGEVSKKIYVLVVDKSEDEVVLFSEDFSENTLDYSVWQQTEYYWDTPYQVTEQKPYSDKYIEGYNISQVGAVPFVTRDYWDALELGGPRSAADAGGTGYNWNKIFMNNAKYYAYIREDYVTNDGVKLSDLGIYNVTMAGESLNPGTNISEYKASNDTYGGIRMEYNGIGIMGRINFKGETYFKQGTSSMHSFMWDGPIKASAGSAKSEASTNINLTNSFGVFSLKAEYRLDKLVGRYIPITNARGYFEVPSYTTEVVATATAGSMGFYTEARDILIYDFTVSYPITKVVDGVELEATAENNIVTVPVNGTIDLAKYTFLIDGKTVKGNEVAWSGARSAIGELDSYNKTFTGFSVGEVTINGVKFVVTDEAIAGPKSIVDVKGNGALSFAPGSESNVYKVTATAADRYLLKAGVLTVTYDDGTVKTVPVDNNGIATITTDYVGAIKVAAEFVEKQELGFVSLGATIRLPGTKDAAGNTLKPGIRFGARLNNIRLTEGKAVLDSEITINGVDYKVAELGSLIIPARLLNGSELTVNSKNAQKKRVTMVSNVAEDHADITAVLVGIPETWYDLDIAFRGYIKYTNLDGTGEYYVYTDEISRTYNGVMKAAPVYDTGAYFDATNTSLMLTASKANIKYALGEQMVVFADTYIGNTMANGIKLTYKVYAGNADGYSGSAIASGTAISASNASVKLAFTPDEAGYYFMVVSAYDADDNVVVTKSIRLGAGIKSAGATNVFDEDNIALSFGTGSDTHIYGDFMNSSNNRNLRDFLKILNNQAGYYSDGTQKLDALLLAGDLTNATAGGSNFNGLPGWNTATTKNEYQYLIYAEWNAMRDIINDGLGDAQFIYSMGNHDSQGSGRGGYAKVDFALRTTRFYQQIMSGKRVDIVPEVGLGMGTNYDKSVLFNAMTEEALADLQYDPNDDYTDSKDYIRHYGRDETSGTMFTLGNRKITINGYTFIVLENTTLQNGFARFTDATQRFLKEALDESVRRDPSAPVFIINHHRPYGTLGDGMGVVDTGSVNLQEILKDYPQAMIWGGHVHDSLQSETSIYQTRTVDENGDVVDAGYTSLTCGSVTSNNAGTHGSPDSGGFMQLVQVDVNGNVRITKYTVGASADSTDCEVDDNVSEITMNEYGQWVKAYDGDTSASPAILTLQTINNPWYVINSVDDSVRDEYTHDVRAAQFQIGFEPGSATLNGKTLTFKKAINKLGYNNENTTITRYYAFLFDANSQNIETQVLSTNVAGYAKYTDMPDTYTINFNNKGAFVIIRAYDFWVAYLGTEHPRYISNDAQIAVNQSQP